MSKFKNLVDFYHQVDILFDPDNIKPSLDFVFKFIDTLLLDNKMDICDELFRDERMLGTPTKIKLAMLIATFTFRNRFTNRQFLFNLTRKELQQKLGLDESKRVIDNLE